MPTKNYDKAHALEMLGRMLGHGKECIRPDQHAAVVAKVEELTGLLDRVRADCEAQYPGCADPNVAPLKLGRWSQARRVLNILQDRTKGGA